MINKERAKELRKNVKNYNNKNQAAKLMFFSGESAEQIAKVIDMPVELIDFNIKKGQGWKVEQNRDGVTAVNYFVQCKSRALEETAGMALTILARGLKAWFTLQEEGLILNEKQLTAASSILNNLDKIQRLEEGKATDIIHRSGLTVAEARQQLNADPMAYGIIDVTPQRKDLNDTITKEMVKKREEYVEKENAGLEDDRPNVFGESFAIDQFNKDVKQRVKDLTEGESE